MIFLNSSENEVETISQRKFRSASGLDLLIRSLLTCLWISLKHTDPICLLPLRNCVWAVLAWTAASCDFSEILKSLITSVILFFRLRYRSKLAIIPLIVITTCDHAHLWFWQWWRPRLAIRWVKQEVSFVTFLSSTLLWSLVVALVPLFSCFPVKCSIVSSKNANFGASSSNLLVLFCFVFFFVCLFVVFFDREVRFLPYTLKFYRSTVSLIDSTVCLHSRLLC